MPRPAQFDREQALLSAMEVFWANGYGASSIQKLLDAMEINRGSLYASFGDKQSLFGEVVDRYTSEVCEEAVEIFLSEPDVKSALKQFFSNRFLVGDTVGTTKGCLLFNAITELSESNPALAAEASGRIRGLRNTFAERLQTGRENGQLMYMSDSEQSADILVTLLSGLCVLCKMGATGKQVTGVINSVIDGL